MKSIHTIITFQQIELESPYRSGFEDTFEALLKFP